jgi:hypothetical protein
VTIASFGGAQNLFMLAVHVCVGGGEGVRGSKLGTLHLCAE